MREALRAESNPPNPWLGTHVEWLGEPPPAELRVHLEAARSLLSANDSPDIPFRFSANPYRGCTHACSYCYARPTHTWLGFGAGTDFDTRIVVKTNAPDVLARELARRSWKREVVCLSGNTDPYQPIDAHYGLTRRCLEVLLDADTPVMVITKGSLVRRDLDLLAKLAEGPGAIVHLSIPTADERVARLLEPGAPPPAARFETLRQLAAAGVPAGVAVAPLILGLTDSGVPEVLERATAAGATHAFHVPLRLPKEVDQVFEERLRIAFPERAAKVLHAQEELRGGKRNEPRFGERMGGRGPRYEAARNLFLLHARRLGLGVGEVSSPNLPRTETSARHTAARSGAARRGAGGDGARGQGDLFAADPEAGR